LGQFAQTGFDAAKDTFDAARAMNLLSHTRKLTALRIYLPANTNGNGYLLTPSMQAFHVRPGGTVEFQGTPAPGLKAEGSRILLP
jgi:hypothetical protein